MSPRRAVLVLVVLLIALGVWSFLRAASRSGDTLQAASSPSDATSGLGVAAAPAQNASGSDLGPVLPEARRPENVADDDAFFGDLFPTDDPAWAWSRIDLEDLREEMPDNAFWSLGAPTDDPAVLDRRRERRDRMNRELGKVMSNTGTEAEVRAYYTERERVSSDYVAFTSRLLERYGDVLPERDHGLVSLARDMHRARLEELPRHLREALDRRETHAAAREAWLAEEALFATDRGEANAD